MDELLDATAIAGLRTRLAAADPTLDLTHVDAVGSAVDGHKLRARTDLVTDALLADLPADYAAFAQVVRRLLVDESFRGWTLWPVTEAVARRAPAAGNDASFDDGLALLAELTPRLTSEFAIRGFLAADLDRTLVAAERWTRHPDEHVRRLASEGTRSYLPWAVRIRELIDRPSATIPLLDALHRDESEYVRRSVANHLNDLARHAPDLVVETADRWRRADDDDPVSADRTARVVRHGLRTLVKKGHPGALALLGHAPASVAVTTELAQDVVRLPGVLELTAQVTNTGPEVASLAVDYAVHYVKADGRRSPKVFKLAVRTVAPGETITLTKRHGMRQMTTRVHHPGIHAVEIQVNGERHPLVEFTVLT
ncbi:DNA alkylation repair protein [Oerskovia flava]|uniref:DNA alkylation repair protein n=1 Tax=Oerskovia flava TaxID=2986422 RepID=UPI00223FE1A2|nr:DNA alkylation repair protein [Oerskovia sp. JB1-3-2]